MNQPTSKRLPKNGRAVGPEKRTWWGARPMHLRPRSSRMRRVITAPTKVTKKIAVVDMFCFGCGSCGSRLSQSEQELLVGECAYAHRGRTVIGNGMLESSPSVHRFIAQTCPQNSDGPLVSVPFKCTGPPLSNTSHRAESAV